MLLVNVTYYFRISFTTGNLLIALLAKIKFFFFFLLFQRAFMNIFVLVSLVHNLQILWQVINSETELVLWKP